MSERPLTHGSGSSAPGLTFVRPMPRSVPAMAAGSEDAVATRVRAFSVPDRLFPSRDVEAAHGPPPVKGIQLAHFSIEERIGRGGMGSVFRAMDVRLDRVVALKVLAPDFSNDFEAVQRFRNEARAAAQLDHNNIARVHFIGEEQGLHFIAFEFVPGVTVRQRIDAEGRLPQSLALNCALQIASALRHTAAMHVVHRDIKPSNLLLLEDGRVKLVDLGLARDLNQRTPSDLTVAGTALGTYDYISPEQALDARNVDVRSDIYSLGCTLYHMVTGSPPYPQGTVMQKVVLHHQRTPPSAFLQNPELSPKFSSVIQRMMASDPLDRPADPEELIAELTEVAQDLELQPIAPETLVWNPPDQSHWSRMVSGARTWGVVVLILAAIVLLDRWRWTGSSAAWRGPSPLTVEDGGPASVGNVPVAPPSVAAIDKPGPGGVNPSPGNNPGSAGGAPPAVVNALGNAAGIANPAVAPPRTLMETGQGPFVVIVPNSLNRLRRPTLAGAVAVAPSNAIIELQMQGPLEVQEPLKIIGKNIRLRKGEGARPLLRFNLDSLLALGTASREVSLIEVERGVLDLADLDVEMVVTAAHNADWSLIAVGPQAELMAAGCSFTIINPGNSVARLLHIRGAEAANVPRIPGDRRESSPAGIQFKECLVRGEGDFAQQDWTRNVHYQLENVGIAISGTLLRLDASEESEAFVSRIAEGTTTLAVDHITACAAQGLLRSDSRDRGRIPRVEIEISDSVFRQDNPQVPFIVLRGDEEFETLHSRLHLRETRDPSFYQLAGPVCLVQSTGLLAGDPFELGLEDLGADSSQLIGENLLQLGQPAPNTPRSSWPKSVLMLQPSPANPAQDASGDMLDAGVNWRLQRIPDPPAPELDAQDGD